MSLNYVEIVSVFFAILYIIAAAREHNSCWLWAIISSGLWAYASYFDYHLYIDAILQLFFVVMAFYGLYEWKYAGDKKKELKISTMKASHHIWIIIGGLALSYLIGYYFANYTPAAATYLDALTTVFSVINTFILIKKKIENWIYWIAIDALLAYLFFSRGAYFFGGLYALYVVLSVDGYFRWKRSGQWSVVSGQ